MDDLDKALASLESEGFREAVARGGSIVVSEEDWLDLGEEHGRPRDKPRIGFERLFHGSMHVPILWSRWMPRGRVVVLEDTPTRKRKLSSGELSFGQAC